MAPAHAQREGRAATDIRNRVQAKSECQQHGRNRGGGLALLGPADRGAPLYSFMVCSTLLYLQP
jgi:hypothetical protein